MTTPLTFINRPPVVPLTIPQGEDYEKIFSGLIRRTGSAGSYIYTPENLTGATVEAKARATNAESSTTLWTFTGSILTPAQAGFDSPYNGGYGIKIAVAGALTSYAVAANQITTAWYDVFVTPSGGIKTMRFRGPISLIAEATR